MKILQLEQNTPEWLAARAQHFCASEAPAMMSASKFQSRSDLLRMKATGITEKIDARTQSLFDAGHKAEDEARKQIEEMFEPFPKTTATDDEGWLLASYDGLNESHTVAWECKLWNEKLAAMVRAKDLSPQYYWQLEHQILVGNLKGVIFTCSDGTPDKCVSMKYRPVPGRAEQLIAGWKQFERDLAGYKPVEVIPSAVAAPTLALPAVSIQVSGKLALTTNLDRFLIEAKAFVSRIPEKLITDQDFVDGKDAIKRLQEAQNALDAAEANAIGQVASFDAMKRAKARCVEVVRNARLATEKLVEREEKKRKEEIVMFGIRAFTDHVASLNARLGGNYMPAIAYYFGNAIKGLSKLDSMKEKVNNELVRLKLESNAIADGIEMNHKVMTQLCDPSLFPDFAQVCTKAPDDFAALILMRVAHQKEAYERRLAAEREKIRAEEQAKAQREAEAKVKAEQEAIQKAAAQQEPRIVQEARNIEPAAAAAPKPAVKLTSKGIRPDDDAIIEVLALHYRVHESTVITWLLDVDLSAASKRMAQEFTA